MQLTWYNVTIINNDGLHELKEKRSKVGRYAKRKEIEPLVISMDKTRKENAHTLSIIKTNIEDIRAHFSKDNDDKHVFTCNDILNKIDKILSK